MSAALRIMVTAAGLKARRADVQKIRAGLTTSEARTRLHTRIAGAAQKLTQQYLIGQQEHKTAERLEAKPTGHRGRAAKAVESRADAAGGEVLIPRATGLARAFGDITIRPVRAKVLTLAAHKITYGRSPREFPDDAFDAVVFDGRHPALVFDYGPYEGEVAYWMARQVKQKQDRGLLPADGDYLAVSDKAARQFVRGLMRNGGTES